MPQTPDEQLTHCQPTIPSPFIEGTAIQFAWDSVSLSTILECPQRYRYKIIEGWSSKNPNSAIALTFGILVHTGVEEYHRARCDGLKHDAAVQYALRRVMEKQDANDPEPLYARIPIAEDIEQLKQDAEDDESQGTSLRNSKVRTRYHLWRALVWYFEQYRNDPMEVVRLADGRPAVEYSFRVAVGKQLTDGTEILQCGHIDRLVRFNGQVFVVDTKTTKSISRSYFAGFDLSHQMSGYTLGGKLALSEAVAGTVIDAIELQVGGVRFARAFTQRTESQLAEYRNLLAYVGSMAERYFYEDYYPLNTAACMFCEFKDICRQPPELRHGYLNQLFERKEAWNPLKSR